MKIYNEEDIKNFERDEYGRLICPSGDYTQIKSFGEYCSFGKCCSFGEECSFGEYCSFGKSCSFGKECCFGESCSFGECCNLENNLRFENIPEQIIRIIKIDRIGSRQGCTYFFKTLSQIYVRCGCFFGTIEKFEAEVNETHKNHDKYRKEYLEAIKYIKAVI